MTCNLEKTKVFPSSRSRWAEKAHLCNSLRSPEANLGSWPRMPNYSKKLKKTVSGGLARKCMAALIWISPRCPGRG